MTLKEFKNIKVGDLCYIPQTDNKLLGTEVLKKDNIFNKLTVLLGRKSYSYKYVRKTCPIEKQGPLVGMCKGTWASLFY